MVQDNEAIGFSSEDLWAVDDTAFADLYVKYGFKYDPDNREEFYEVMSKDCGCSVEKARELCGGAVSDNA